MSFSAVREIRVEGLAELNRALSKAGRETRLGIRRELRRVVKPVQVDAERLATAEISRLGVPWSKMRIGITTNTVYVAPRQHGTKSGSKKRKNLAPLLQKSMTEALEDNIAGVEAAFDHMLETVAAEFNA